MLFKVLFYAYLNNIYSWRKIAKGLEENIYFLWLSGNSRPDFRTIQPFSRWMLERVYHGAFTQIVLLLLSALSMALSLSQPPIDTFVWCGCGCVEKYNSKHEDRIRSVLSMVDTHIEQDKQEEGLRDTAKVIDSDLLRKKVNKLNSCFDKMDKIEQKQVQKLQEDSLPRLQKHEDQLEKLGDRNSYSKTDGFNSLTMIAPSC